MAKKIIVTIDGFSSCGKSTLAKQMARELKYTYVDSGAMYRAITLYFLQNRMNWEDPEQVKKALEDITLSFELNPTTLKSEMHLNGENVEAYIRDLIVADKVSEVAAVGAIREFAVAQQQEFGLKKGIVMDGRDIGTVVFPDAELKIFMTASPEIRVKRRFQELYESNHNITLDEVRHNLELRDYIDSNREISPLRQAKDALVLDNSHLTMEEQLKMALKWVEERKELVSQ